MVTERLKSFVLFCYITAILFIPRLNTLFGDGIQRNLRAEDIFFPFMLILCVISLRKRTLFYAQGPIIYIFYSLVVTLFGLMIFSIPAKALFIWGKEFQYIVGFILFIECLNGREQYILYFERIILTACFVSAIYFIYRLLTFEWSGYGVTHFTEKISPSLTSWIYFNLFFLALTIKNFENKDIHPIFLNLLIVSLFFGILSGGTRTMFMCLPVFLIMYWFMSLPAVKTVMFSMTLIFFIFIFSLFHDQLVSYLYSIKADTIAMPLARFRSVFDLFETIGITRANSWNAVLNIAISSSAIYFGGGRGFTHLDSDGNMPSLGLGADNQYTVNFSEIGLLGNILLIMTILCLISFVHKKYWKLYIPYIVVYMAGGMTCEIFQLSKAGQLFWITTGYFIIYSDFLKRKEIYAPGSIKNNDLANSEKNTKFYNQNEILILNRIH